MAKACLTCGKSFEPKQPHHQYCSPECKEKAKASEVPERRSAVFGKGRENPRPAQAPPTQASHNVDDASLAFSTFYEDKNLSRDVFLGRAQELTQRFEDQGLTRSQLRQLFFMLKSTEQRLKADPLLDLGVVRETVYKFVRQVKYQVKRGVLTSPLFEKFVLKNEELACKSKEEFKGFVELMTSVVAYLREK